MLVTLSGSGNFTPIRGGEINAAGDLQNGLWTFDSPIVYGNDWVTMIGEDPRGADVYLDNGHLIIETPDNGGDASIAGASASMQDTTFPMLNTSTNGDFTVRVEIVDAGADGWAYCGIGYRIDDSKYFFLYITSDASTGDLTQVSLIKAVSGTRTIGTSSNPPSILATPIWLQLTRSANNFSIAYAETEEDLINESGTYNNVGGASMSESFETSGNLFLAAEYRGYPTATGTEVTFDNFTWVSGKPNSAEFKINDSGDTKISLSENNYVDKEKITAEASGELRIKEYIGYSDSFGAYGSNSEWSNYEVNGNYPHTTNTGNNWWPYVTTSGDSATFTSLSFYVGDSNPDITPPSGIETYFSYKDAYETSLDVFLKWYNGYDQATESGDVSGYKGTTLGYFNDTDGNWYYLQSGENWDTTEVFDDLYFYAGSGAKWIEAFQEIPNGVSKIRYTGWDNEGNSSFRIDEDLLSGTGMANYGSGVIHIFSNNEYYGDEIMDFGVQKTGAVVFNPFGN